MFLSAQQVAARYGWNVSTVWRRTKSDAEFPQPVKIGPQSTRWRLADLEAWEAAIAA